MEFDFTIGKYTLESLTNGMYSTPLDVYREYVQNASDSFDEYYIKNNADKQLLIQISVDTDNKRISILDNGVGISQNVATKTLIDIGNSKKERNVSRGFRGIGRLAGLGYCETLIFSTSYSGEPTRTEVSFDAARLRQLLIDPMSAEQSLQDVINSIISVNQLSESVESHYFCVEMRNVDLASKLLDIEAVRDYIIQNCPLPYSREFIWASMIENKLNYYGYCPHNYNIQLCYGQTKEQLYKPYRNAVCADRVRKVEESICDIEVVPFYINEHLSALLWYAKTNHIGTILDNSIKGIRMRHGNIMVGGRTTFNKFFKEERFNGWVLGELYVLDANLLVNSRRDDFERNSVYYALSNELEKWASQITKDIRKKSYERSLSHQKQKILDDDIEDVNSLDIEDLGYLDENYEAGMIDMNDAETIAEEDLYSKMMEILNSQKGQTKYTALNLNDKITVEQRKILERVFDIIAKEYSPKEADKLATIIAYKF